MNEIANSSTNSDSESLPESNFSLRFDEHDLISITGGETENSKFLLYGISKSSRKYPVFHFKNGDHKYVMNRDYTTAKFICLKCSDEKCPGKAKLEPISEIFTREKSRKKRIKLNYKNSMSFDTDSYSIWEFSDDHTCATKNETIQESSYKDFNNNFIQEQTALEKFSHANVVNSWRCKGKYSAYHQIVTFCDFLGNLSKIVN